MGRGGDSIVAPFCTENGEDHIFPGVFPESHLEENRTLDGLQDIGQPHFRRVIHQGTHSGMEHYSASSVS